MCCWIEQKRGVSGLLPASGSLIYTVLAAYLDTEDEDTHRCRPWIPPPTHCFYTFLLSVQARAFLPKRHQQASRIVPDILPVIRSFLRFEPNWQLLEQRVAACLTIKLPQTAAEAVQQYRHFMKLKVDACDWKSELLSPPLLNSCIDDVWHIHLLDTLSYQEDCRIG